MNFSDEVEYLAKAPADRIAGFTLSLRPQPPEEAYPISISCDLRCKACSGDIFRFFCFPVVAPDPSPYTDVAQGAALRRPPHSAECVKCGVRAKVFDGRTDGYDGRLNGGFAYESGEDGEAAIPGKFRLTVTLTYNIEIDELLQIASETGVQAPDLYDWIIIEGEPAGGGVRFSLDYECA